MKKSVLTKIVALGLAVATALTPVSASAAEKKVVTREEYDQTMMDIYRENEDIISEEESDESYIAMHEQELEYVKSLDGCYQENGAKIYTVLNNGKKTFKKTGTYSIVAGGSTAKKDQGRVSFKAPKTGTYTFTMVAKTNVVGGAQCNSFSPEPDHGYACKLKYYDNGKLTTKPNCGSYLLADPARNGGAASRYSWGTAFDCNESWLSTMTKITITYKMTKGETADFVIRGSHADLDEEQWAAYNFVGMDLTIKKIK